MKTPKERFEMTRQQAVAKIRWGARQQEVLDWLQEKHGIVGEEAQRLLAEAYRARRKAIRENALIRLVLSIIGMVLVAAFVYIRFGVGVIFYGGGAILTPVFAIGLGYLSISTFIRSLNRLFTGETAGPVD